MSWKTAILLACALLIPAAAMAAKAKPKAAAPAPAVAPAAAKPAPVKPVASPIADFDARNPSSVMAILNLGGAKATLVSKDTDAVLLNVTSVAANFTVFFASCDAQGRACKALQFDLRPAQRFQPDLGHVPRL
jgi:hypothetical protein